MVKALHFKRVAVLMATHNGINWIHDQINSILNQINVDVTIFISDDNSVDGTFDYLFNLAKKNRRVVLLPRVKTFGSAAKNFYHLICHVDFDRFNYISLSDQDDIWNKDKLFNHMTILEKNKAAAVSSNVIAFWPSGKEVLINKSQSQRKYDFLFEGPGPGCTFLISPWLINKVRYQLKNKKITVEAELHDWLIYAICRVCKGKWVISPKSSLRYRQHSSNVLGANFGAKAAFGRFKNILNGWYRGQVKVISEVTVNISFKNDLYNFNAAIKGNSILDCLKLLVFAIEGRRKLSERFF